MSHSLQVNLFTQTGVEWDYTRQLNGGSLPAINSANAELHLCEEGEAWSSGTTCYPATRIYSKRFDGTYTTFSFPGVSEFSFVVWFKQDNANPSG